MENKYFKQDEDFESIMNSTLDGEEIKDINFISTGWTNLVFEVDTDKNAYFFRFPRDEFWSRTIIKGYEFCQYIYNKTNFHTIKLELFHDQGRPFSRHRKVEGVPLAERMNELSEEEVASISDEIADFMNQLHNIQFNDRQIFDIDDIGLELNDFLDELLNLYVSEEDKEFWTHEPSTVRCLVHGDLNPSNIILDENNDIAAIIDFGFAGFGNKYDDIARIIGRCPSKFKDEIVKYYEHYSHEKIDSEILDEAIDTWSNIDSAYINYMRKIGIYDG